MIEGQIVAGQKENGAAGSLENIPAIFFRMNKRTYVLFPRRAVGEKMRESPGWADDERKQRTLSIFECEIRERSRVHLRDERPLSAHEEVSRTTDGINSRARAICSTRRHCNEFCQFTEQTCLAASSRPKKKAANARVATQTIRRLRNYSGTYSQHQHVAAVPFAKIETKGQIRLMSAIPCIT